MPPWWLCKGERCATRTHILTVSLCAVYSSGSMVPALDLRTQSLSGLSNQGSGRVPDLPARVSWFNPESTSNAVELFLTPSGKSLTVSHEISKIHIFRKDTQTLSCIRISQSSPLKKTEMKPRIEPLSPCCCRVTVKNHYILCNSGRRGGVG